MKLEDQILSDLRRHLGQYVSGQFLSETYQVSRTSIWKEIGQLKKAGYRIRAHAKKGYCLYLIPDKLLADEISWGLKTKIIGHSIFSYESMGSTNDAVMTLGKSRSKEGVVVFSEYQHQGRGRLGRQWISPKFKNILFSVLLRPDMLIQDIPRLTLISAVSIAKAIQAYTGLQAQVKWPNDILFQGKKLCGILTEMQAESDRVQFVVLGVGLNVNAVGKDLFPGSTSLKKVLKKKIHRVECAQAILKQLDTDYVLFKAGGFARLLDEWQMFSDTIGRRVGVKLHDRKISGLAMSIDDSGALMVRLDNGFQERVLSGDVYHLR